MRSYSGTPLFDIVNERVFDSKLDSIKIGVACQNCLYLKSRNVETIKETTKMTSSSPTLWLQHTLHPNWSILGEAKFELSTNNFERDNKYNSVDFFKPVSHATTDGERWKSISFVWIVLIS